jgi:hypothetical protein
MSRRLGSIAAAIVLSAAAVYADACPVALTGQLASSAGRRAAQLRIQCEPAADGGALGIELWVPEAFTRKDFDYDHFEGPDAVASGRALSRLSVSGAGSHVEIVHAAAAGTPAKRPTRSSSVSVNPRIGPAKLPSCCARSTRSARGWSGCSAPSTRTRTS